MKRIKFLLLAIMGVMCVCNISAKIVDDSTVTGVVTERTATNADLDKELLLRGAAQVASLWQEADGSIEDYSKFIKDNYIAEADGST